MLFRGTCESRLQNGRLGGIIVTSIMLTSKEFADLLQEASTILRGGVVSFELSENCKVSSDPKLFTRLVPALLALGFDAVSHNRYNLISETLWFQIVGSTTGVPIQSGVIHWSALYDYVSIYASPTPTRAFGHLEEGGQHGAR